MADLKGFSYFSALFKMLFFSALGIFVFFIPITIAGNNTIFFDHVSGFVLRNYPKFALAVALLLVAFGAVYPFVSGSYKKSRVMFVVALFRVLGALLTALFFCGFLPNFLLDEKMMPFIFYKLGVPVAVIIPVGALMLAFLLSFGLIEGIGVLMRPVMKKIWRTPGMSAVDAVASFVGSYSLALIITNRVYKDGFYSPREAAIIATGFSTMSTAFMVVIARTLGLMEFWSFYFWSSLLITFVVTAITARMPPLSSMSDEKPREEALAEKGAKLERALAEGMKVAHEAPPVWCVLWLNLKDGLLMASAVVPSIISVGLLGLVLQKYTPIFDVLGLLLYPFAWLGQMPEAWAFSKGMSTMLAELYLPAVLLAESDVFTSYVAAVCSVSAIVFFSSFIPCVLATDIPISVPKMLVIWFERMALSILFACAFAHLAVYLGWFSL